MLSDRERAMRDELTDQDFDDYELEDEERDPDDCMDCGICDACIEQSRAYAEEMEKELDSTDLEIRKQQNEANAEWTEPRP